MMKKWIWDGELKIHVQGLIRKHFRWCYGTLGQVWKLVKKSHYHHSHSTSTSKRKIETAHPSKTHAFAKARHLRIQKLLGFRVFIFAIIWGWRKQVPFSRAPIWLYPLVPSPWGYPRKMLEKRYDKETWSHIHAINNKTKTKTHAF